MRHNMMRKIPALMLAVCAVLLSFVFPSNAEFHYTPINMMIPFACEKANVAGGGKYDVVIEPLESSNPMPDEDTITIIGNGVGVFTIEIDEPGTYLYKVYEKTGDDSHIIYDDTQYTVTLFVTTDDDGVLECQVILSKGGLIKPTEVRFVNKATRSPNEIIVATGEASSAFIPYAVAAFTIGFVLILILVLKRRKEDRDGEETV
ncbi:pilin isopeptide linkage domain-containing protein [Ruminococcaceae bacterium YRB3002]|nr:pilin isopeptide linkage domain-containing protein [Ruminococcaceae bacterium YRB3002]